MCNTYDDDIPTYVSSRCFTSVQRDMTLNQIWCRFSFIQTILLAPKFYLENFHESVWKSVGVLAHLKWHFITNKVETIQPQCLSPKALQLIPVIKTMKFFYCLCREPFIMVSLIVANKIAKTEFTCIDWCRIFGQHSSTRRPWIITDEDKSINVISSLNLF